MTRASAATGAVTLIHRKEECDYAVILEQAIKDMSRLHGDRFEVESENSPCGECDPGAFRRILDNLLSNKERLRQVTEVPVMTGKLRQSSR